jgi:hypothetical protein
LQNPLLAIALCKHEFCVLMALTNPSMPSKLGEISSKPEIS